MMRRTLNHRTAGTAAALVAVGLVLAGCGGSSDDAGGDGDASPQPTGSADSALAAKVPDAIKEDGVISVGSDSTYAPAEFLAADGSTIEGFDVDLAKQVGAKLGLKVEFVTAPFDNIIAGVKSGKYEMGVSSFTINPDRVKQVDMVSYFSAGTQWAVKKGNPADVDPDDACGKRVAVQKGTVQVEDVAARSTACTDAGKEAITVQQYDGQDQVTSSVVSGKADAELADSPVVAYAERQTKGEVELVGEIYDAAPYGYVVKKGQDDFAQAVADALKATIEDGSYEKALSGWNVQEGAITDPAVNPSDG